MKLMVIFAHSQLLLMCNGLNEVLHVNKSTYFVANNIYEKNTRF